MTDRNHKTWFQIIGLSLFACVGFGMAAYFAYNATILVQRGKSTMATCTKIETKTTDSGNDRITNTTYHVTYVVEGQGAQQGHVDASFAGLREGGTIEVLYDPQQPDRVQANRFISLWGMAILCGVGGLILLPPLLWRKPSASSS